MTETFSHQNVSRLKISFDSFFIFFKNNLIKIGQTHWNQKLGKKVKPINRFIFIKMFVQYRLFGEGSLAHKYLIIQLIIEGQSLDRLSC